MSIGAVQAADTGGTGAKTGAGAGDWPEPIRSASPAPFIRKRSPSGVGPLALIILDGFGWRQETRGNAVTAAKKPVFDDLWSRFPHTTLQASEEAVGLPKGQFGNSEVGHSNIGAGRVLYQDLTRITRDIKSGYFFKNPVLMQAMQYAVNHHSRLHLAGLVSQGGVHSHLDHLLALLQMASQMKVQEVCVHAFTDGRDVAPDSARKDLAYLQQQMEQTGVGRIATVSGRYYAMDRDNRWQRTELAYRAMVYGEGKRATGALQAIEDSYAKDVTDEFILPTVLVDQSNRPVGRVRENDAVILFNFRPDRAIQISKAFSNEEFTEFNRGPQFPHVFYVCMTKYSDAVEGLIAYPPDYPTHTAGEVFSDHGLAQLRIAETEKYPHVTFFFSGGREDLFPGEQRVMLPSPKVATYDLQPEMSAYPLAAAAVERIRSGEVDVVILNFANPDMVGHTGVFEAAVKAVETVDACLGQVYQALAEMGGMALITADHGNADTMFNADTGEVCTTHTLSLVPLIVTKPGARLREDGVLADLTPTLLDLLGIGQPTEMTGQTLLVR
ncbi:2,3-bisphosphoglycerate-independent phosphoglycerate mutase [Alicyclobacillaceae bacterium I2511]|nr:2,3-bisphosphoglycerate-independent phosphoglycerate mutase [Alicyclobacillaceae bacterium I2511]